MGSEMCIRDRANRGLRFRLTSAGAAGPRRPRCRRRPGPGAVFQRPHRLHAVPRRPRLRRQGRPGPEDGFRRSTMADSGGLESLRGGRAAGRQPRPFGHGSWRCRHSPNYCLTIGRLVRADPRLAPPSGQPSQPFETARICWQKPASTPRAWCIVSLLALCLPRRHGRPDRRSHTSAIPNGFGARPLPDHVFGKFPCRCAGVSGVGVRSGTCGR